MGTVCRSIRRVFPTGVDITSKDQKTIFDPIHGSIKIGGVYLDILDRHEMQRLRYVKQLDMGYMVFPGANHTRFEHCLGTYRLSERMAESLGLSDEDKRAVMAAGLLHDVCHPPFSHTLEEMIYERTGMDHMDMARRLIMGDVRTYRERDADMFSGVCSIGEILSDSGIDPKRVCDLIEYPTSKVSDDFVDKRSYFPSGDYVHQIIHGPIDADQMDYLMRDAHYTGVTWGSIDVERILNTIKVYNDRIVVDRGGLVSAEGLMVSRSLMYSAVYYHVTVRIIKQMLIKAVECSDIDIEEIHTWDDADLTNALIDGGGRSSYLMRSVLSRNLYKSAITLYNEEVDEEAVATLAQYSSYHARKELEQDIADKAEVDITEMALDMPSRSTILSEVKIGKTDVTILDPSGKARSITRFSPIAKGLQSRDPFGWKLMVAASREHVEKVEKATRKVLNL